MTNGGSATWLRASLQQNGQGLLQLQVMISRGGMVKPCLSPLTVPRGTPGGYIHSVHGTFMGVHVRQGLAQIYE
jgi:hypothetical protein